jgi:AsmA protein
LRVSEGKASQARLAISAAPAAISFEGDWSLSGDNEFDGPINVRVFSLDRLMGWLGAPAPPPLMGQEIQLEAKAVGGASALALSDAHLEIGGQKLEGSLDVSRAGAKFLASGTLAADELDLTKALGPPPPLVDGAGGWSREHWVPAPSAKLDLDLRVSAARVTWSAWAVEDAALAILQREGGLTAKLLEASVYDGVLSGEISIQNAADGSRSQASLSLEDADIGALLSDCGFKSYSGRGALHTLLKASGDSPAELVTSAQGSATVDLDGGAVAGINFEEALRRSLRRPVDVARDMATGQTKFASAGARLTIADGEARIVEAHTQGPGATLEVQGAIDLKDREWRARIVAMQASAMGAPSVDAAHLTLDFVGPWRAPTLSPTQGTD